MKYIFKAIIDGVVSIIKLCIVLYALYYTVESGLLNELINVWK